METTKIIESAVNNVEYQPQGVEQKYAEQSAKTKLKVYKILDGNTSISSNEVLGEQDTLIKQTEGMNAFEQIAFLGVGNDRIGGLKSHSEATKNSAFGSPDKTITLGAANDGNYSIAA